jgi:D-arabinose 5-phosphate isomerase GutQ
VLDVELAGLTAVRARIDASFERAIDLLLACRGKVVVTGVGKSGLVGRKIAATFASTGTPALFLHASEGSHGDLGVLARGDLLVAASYSGETKELLHLLPLVQRLEIPLLVLTGAPASSLGRAADVTLDASVPEEACRWGWHPPRARRRRWPSATRWPSRCSRSAASRPKTSGSSTLPGRSGAGYSGSRTSCTTATRSRGSRPVRRSRTPSPRSAANGSG